MTQHPQTRRWRERGNIFFTLFGAVALVGVLGTGIMATMRGPLSTMVEVNRRAQAESQMQISSKLSLLEAAQQADDGDCDADGYVEALEWADASNAGPDGVTGSDGGGFLPTTLGSTRRDPWGTDYGYCVWDAGTSINDAGCGGVPQKRLVGSGTDDRTYTTLAIISAGPDRVFQTACLDFATADANSNNTLDTGEDPLVKKVSGADDVIFQYTYDDARGASDGLWTLKVSDPSTAEITKDIEVAGASTFSSDVTLGASATLTLGAASLILPTQATLATCNGANLNLLRINTTTTPNILEICDDDENWYNVTQGSTPSIWQLNTTHAYYNGGNVGIGTNTPSSKLEVVGNLIVTSGDIGIGDSSPDGTLLLDVEGQAGATEFCDEGGNSCFDTADLLAGSVGVPGNDREVIFNSSGSFSSDSTFMLETTGALTLGSQTLISVGLQAGSTNSGTNVTTMGYQSGKNNTADKLAAFGYQAGKNNTGTSLTAFGFKAGAGSVSGNEHTFVGDSAGFSDSGSGNTSIGYLAGSSASSTTSVFTGNQAGNSASGTNVVGVGAFALNNNTANSAVAVGRSAGASNSGAGLVAMGYRVAENNSGARTIAIGEEAGSGNSGDDVVAIGYQAGFNNSTANQFIVKQTNINATPLIQGDFSTGNVAIGTSTPGSGDEKLKIVGTAANHQVRVEKTGTGNINLGVDSTGGFVETQTNIPLRFYESGAERMRITSGDVGIGDTSPDGTLLLDVEGQIGATEYCDENGANCTTAASLAPGGGAGSHWTKTGTDEIYYSTANVGIGLSDPAAQLEIQSETSGTEPVLKIDHGAGTHQGIGLQISSANTGDAIDLSGTGANSGYFEVTTAYSTDPNLHISGNVGIGTNDPDVNLDIVSSSGSAAVHIDGGDAGGIPIIRLKKQGTNKWGWLGEYPSTGTSSFFSYDLGDSVITMLSDGKVGIGNTAPKSKLHVAGDLLLTNSATCAADNKGAIRLNASSDSLQMCDGAGGWVDIAGSSTGLVAFRATSNNGQSIGYAVPQVAVFEDEEYDTNSAYNTANGHFTAPETGFYQFSSTLHFNGTGNVPTNIRIVSGSKTVCYLGTHDSGISNDRVSCSGAIHLTLNDQVYVEADIGGSSASNLQTDSISSFSGFKVSSGGSSSIWASGSGNEIHYTNTDGNVGIGLADPSSVLHLYGTGAGSVGGADPDQDTFRIEVKPTTGTGLYAVQRLFLDASSAGGVSGRGPSISFEGLEGGNSNRYAYANIGALAENGSTGNDIAGAFIINTKQSAGIITERMRVDSSGNVGIGTTSPGAELDISGQSGTTDGLLQLNETRVGDGGWVSHLNFQYNGTDVAAISTSGSASGADPGSTGLRFFTSSGLSAGQYKMILEDDGAVAIGTTATADADLKLDVDGKIGAPYYCHSDGSSCKTIAQLSASGSGYWSENSGEIYYNVGNVGIGTADPGAALDVRGSGTEKLRVVHGTSGSITKRIDISPGDTRHSIQYTANPLDIWNDTDETITFLTNGNVGIGTNNPGYELEVSDGTVNVTMNPYAAGSSGNIGTVSSHPLVLLSGGVERARLDTDGDLGIGTDAPANKLSVNNGTQAFYRSGTTYGSGLGNVSDSSTYDALAIYAQHTNSGDITASGNEIARFQSDGKVGIGTTDPGAILDVQGGTNLLLATGSTGDNKNKYLFDARSDTDGLHITAREDNGNYLRHLITMEHDGNVGIGTDNPQAKLYVVNSPDEAAGIFKNTNENPLSFSVVDIVGPSSTGDYDLLTVSNNGTEESGNVFTVEGDGHVGIGIANPTQALHIQQEDSTVRLALDATGTSHGETNIRFSHPDWAENWQIFMDDNSLNDLGQVDRLGFRVGNSGQVVMTMDGSSYNVGIGTNNPDQGRVEVKGGSVCVDTNNDDNATQCITSESDIRLKKNIIPIENPLDKITQLRGVMFDWRWDEHDIVSRYRDRPHDIGVIAQEVEKVLPEAMGEENQGFKTVLYERFVPLLIESVKELKAENTQLRTELDMLREDVRGLKAHTGYGVNEADSRVLALIALVGMLSGMVFMLLFRRRL